MAKGNVSTKKARGAGISDRRAKSLIRTALDGKPLVEEQLSAEVDQWLLPESPLRVATRMGLIQASKGPEFFQRLATDRDLALTIAGQLEAICEASRLYRQMADVLVRSALRAHLALCKHKDVDSILDEGKERALFVVRGAEGRTTKEASRVQ